MIRWSLKLKLYPNKWVAGSEVRLVLVYLSNITLSGTFLLGIYLVVLAGLRSAGHLPPPPIINSLCADLKLEALRDRLPTAPTHLVVGSSIAMDNFDSSQLALAESGVRPLNEGFCAAQAHQVSFVTRYMTERFPSIHTVIAVVEPHDFRNCSADTEQLFPPDVADDYIFRRRWLYGFYLRYFDLHSLQRNARTLRNGGRQETTPWGDVPLYRQHDLYYGEFEGYDQACFVSLRRMAERLRAAGRRLFVVSSPLNPAWSELYDKSGTIRAEFASGIRAALSKTAAKFWDGEQGFPASRTDYVDAAHLLWPAAQRFTAALVRNTGLGDPSFARRREWEPKEAEINPNGFGIP